MSRTKEAFLALPSRPVSKPDHRFCVECDKELGDADGWNFCADHLAVLFQEQRESAPDCCDEEAA